MEKPITITNNSGLVIYTVFDNPSDFPGKYVLRRTTQIGDRQEVDVEPHLVTEVYGEIRELMEQHGLVCLSRHPSDDACIKETWL